MPLRRVFRGRVVKRTRRLDSHIVLIFRSEPKGTPGLWLRVPLQEYLAEVQTTFVPGRRSSPLLS